MSSPRDPTRNPFDLLGIDPRSTPEAITALMRELAEEVDGDERRRLQGHWRQLTLHPDDRLKAAFFAHPAPARDLPALDDLDGLRRLRLSHGLGALPKALLDPAPDIAELVILPQLRPVARRPDRPAPTWPDVHPDDDVLLKL